MAARTVDPPTLEAYATLEPWAANLAEQGFLQSIEQGRRRRSSRADYAAGWMQAARDLGRLDVFRPEPGDGRPHAP